MNHCFDDVERFMACLQHAAEAQHVVSQRTKKRSKKGSKKSEPSGESCTTKRFSEFFSEDPSGLSTTCDKVS